MTARRTATGSATGIGGVILERTGFERNDARERGHHNRHLDVHRQHGHANNANGTVVDKIAKADANVVVNAQRAPMMRQPTERLWRTRRAWAA